MTTFISNCIIAVSLFSAFDAFAAVSVTSAGTLCPSTTTEISTTNIITNSDFVNTAAPIGTGGGVGTATLNTTPANNNVAYRSGASAQQATFPGDAARNVAASNNWLFANGNTLSASAGIWWSQSVSGLTVGRTYTFFIYGSSPVNGNQNSNPNLSLVVTQASSSTSPLGLIVDDTAAADVWTLYQTTFLATQVSATLSIVNSVTSSNSEPRGQFAMAQPTLRLCSPLVNLSASKSNGVSAVTAGSNTVYNISVTNGGPSAADGSVLRDTPSAGLNCTSVSCTGTSGGAACPVAGGATGQLSIANLITPGAGVTITSLPANSTVTFSLTCGVVATGL
jgi:uncharacterized repeat protein (TIGR01451 family)